MNYSKDTVKDIIRLIVNNVKSKGEIFVVDNKTSKSIVNLFEGFANKKYITNADVHFLLDRLIRELPEFFKFYGFTTSEIGWIKYSGRYIRFGINN